MEVKSICYKKSQNVYISFSVFLSTFRT